MSAINAEIWSRLSTERVRGDILWARRAAPDISDRVLAALDASGNRHLLVLLQPDDIDIRDNQSRGLEVSTRELSMREQQPGRYADIICNDNTGYDAFNLIGGELAERLAAGNETTSDIVTRVLAKWRRFWGQNPNQILSREVQLGLFAELWFLSLWLFPRCGVTEGIRRWKGPFGARHDFEWIGRSVEVKATTSTRGRIHLINGLDQLMPPEQGDLLFFSLRLREEAGATNTLPGLVSNCRAQIQSELDALNDFELGLSQVGYLSAHENEYAKLRVRIVEEGLFTTEDDFPRIVPSNFIEGVPSGVERIEYEINLSGFMHLCVAQRPSDSKLSML